MITLAITTYNRPEMTVKSFQKVLNDTRIDEIIIMDDQSTVDNYIKLVDLVKGMDKVKLYRNSSNFGCYHNKKKAVEAASNDWVILFDSDNEIDLTYLDSMANDEWLDNVIYAPEFARPDFDYRAFSGKTINSSNVANLSKLPQFDCMINTCNYIVNRNFYLKTWQEHKEPWTADTLFHNYNHIKAGGWIHVVEGMQYDHLVHDGSHYKEHSHKTGSMFIDYLTKLKNL